MHQRTTPGSLRSSPTWEGLHEWLREAIQKLLQAALEAEVTELLGRVKDAFILKEVQGSDHCPIGIELTA